MAVLTAPKTSSSMFELSDDISPRGTYVGTCVEVKDVFGVERKKFESEEMEKVDLTGFLFGYRTKDGKPHKVATRAMRISASEKSALFAFLKSWLGRAPQIGWDYCTLKGQKALITVDHQPSRTKPGVMYAVIASISPLPEGFGEQPTPAAPPPVAAPAPAAVNVEDSGDPVPF